MNLDDGGKFISKITSFLELGLIILLAIEFFYPNVYNTNILKILVSINIITYNIIYTISIILVIMGIIVLFLFSYTDKLNDTKINWKFPTDKNKIIIVLSTFIKYIKIISLFILAAMTNHNYTAAITVFTFFEKVIIDFLTPAIRSKTALLLLAKENKDE